jgi:3-oxoacyl-(acyl-carrier-protein) synthase
MAGLHGEPISCPFDRRRNGPLLGEAAVVFLVENEERARARKAKIFARIRGITSFFDAFSISRIHPQGKGLEIAIREALDSAGINSGGIDYISSCANSSIDLDIIEVKVLKRIFGKRLDKIPTSSIKSMFGETISASGSLQVASCIGVMQKEMVPPTANFKEKDPECELDCVPNQAQKKNVKTALVTSFGPGGYNSACVLEKYTDN